MSEPTEDEVNAVFSDPSFPRLRPVCHAPHPDRTDIHCTKDVSEGECLDSHLWTSYGTGPYGGTESLSWDNPKKTPKPEKVSNPSKAQDIANRVKKNTPGQVGKDHPPTSKAAADLVAPKTGSQRYQVLVAIHGAGEHGMTDSEAAAATGIWSYSVVPRRGELTKAGWVVDSGRTRPSERGGEQIVWVMSEAGLEAFPLI